MALAALTGINALLGDFGLGAAAIRSVAALNVKNDFLTARTIVGSVATASLLSSLLFAVPIGILFPAVFRWARLSQQFQHDAFGATLFSLGSFVLASVSSPWRATYNAVERYDLLSAIDSVFGLVSGLGGIGVLILFPTMSSLAALRLILSLARLVTDAFVLRNLLRGPVWPTWSWAVMRPLIGFGAWAWIGNQGNLLLGRLISLILTTSLGSAILPFYELPQRLFTQVHSSLAAQSQFLFPMLASYGEKTGEQINRLDDRLRWFVAVASGGIYCAIALTGPVFLSLLVGPIFAEKARLLLYLACLQGFFQAQDIVPYYTSYALGLGRPNSIIQIGQGLCVAATALFLIPRLGVTGAGLAQLWVVIAVIIHQLWVRQLISPALAMWGWLRSFNSPLIMILVCLSIGWLFRGIANGGWIGTVLAASLGAVAGIGSLFIIEAAISPQNQRWATVMRIVGFVRRRSR